MRRGEEKRGEVRLQRETKSDSDERRKTEEDKKGDEVMSEGRGKSRGSKNTKIGRAHV